MPGGRPTKYDPVMCESVIEMMVDGMSLHTVAANLDICYDTLNEWRKDPEKKEFSDAIKIGLTYSQCWWEESGRNNLATPTFNAILWSMNMRNRFSWSEKPKMAIPGYADAKTPQDKMQAIAVQVQEGTLTSEEIGSAASLTTSLANAEEKTDTRKRVDALEEKTK